jgi:hypothetical protein
MNGHRRKLATGNIEADQELKVAKQNRENEWTAAYCEPRRLV